MSVYQVWTKVQPYEFANFKHEVYAKYPTFDAADPSRPIEEISIEQLAAATAPQPTRIPYPYTQDVQSDREGHDSTGPAAPPPQALPPTPVPTPPQSPQQKPKKQQFQTDQSRPFVLPFSQFTFGDRSASGFVPRSIDEAGRLFSTNFRISTDLWQTVKLREECIADESGTSQAEADLLKHSKAAGMVASLSDRMASLKLDQEETVLDSASDSLEMLYEFERTIWKEHRANIKDAKKAAKLLERAGDVRRLQRVETFYVCLSTPE